MRLAACLLLSVALLFSAEPLAAVFDQAVKALASGNYAAAEQGFQKILAAAPDHVGALQNLGLVYSRTQRFDQAIAIYRRALLLSPNHKGVLMNLGLAYVQQEDYSAALPIFQTVVNQDPQSLPARELLATCEFYTGHLTAAARSFESLAREDPGNDDLLYLMSLTYLKQNHADEAKGALEPLLANSPPARAHFILCRAYAGAGRADEAMEHCRRALESDPNFPGAHREMGKLLASQRDPDAIGQLSAALRQDPNDAEALYSLGVAFEQGGRIDEAVQSLDRARLLRPAFWGNYYYLGKARLGARQAEQAVTLLQRASELNPSASVVFYELGRALKASGRVSESARAMERVRQLRALELENDVKALRQR